MSDVNDDPNGPAVPNHQSAAAGNGVQGRPRAFGPMWWVHRMGAWRYESIDDELRLRSAALASAVSRIKGALVAEYPDADQRDLIAFRLATVDLFVEKAQRVLTKRARRMMFFGSAAALMALASVWGLVMLIYDISRHQQGGQTTNDAVVHIVGSIGLSGVALVSVKWMVALARSYFHENVTLLARRHALRFGRMYVYLNPDDTDIDHLLKAFDWNRGGSSSFLGISVGEVTQTPIGTAVGSAAPASILEILTRPIAPPSSSSSQTTADGSGR